jgi:hypothetical protein
MKVYRARFIDTGNYDGGEKEERTELFMNEQAAYEWLVAYAIRQVANGEYFLLHREDKEDEEPEFTKAKQYAREGKLKLALKWLNKLGAPDPTDVFYRAEVRPVKVHE